MDLFFIKTNEGLFYCECGNNEFYIVPNEIYGIASICSCCGEAYVEEDEE